MFNLFRKKSQALTRFTFVNDQIVYLDDDASTYIKEGYNKNAAVFAIVNYAAKKFGQIPFRVYKVTKDGAKDLARYQYLTKRTKGVTREIIALRKKALDEAIVENDLDALLQQPNRHQGQDSWLEMMYGFKKLTGEGNIWFNTGQVDPGGNHGEPVELLIIPKGNLKLIADGSDPWGINGYRIEFNGKGFDLPKELLMMWKTPTYEFDALTKVHLRGQSPLKSLAYSLQASNAASKREVALNENAGVNGILIDKTERAKPLGPEQVDKIRQMLASRINGVDKAGNVTTMAGDWAYLQLGMDANQLKLIEGKSVSFRELCAGLGVAVELFDPNTTYENKKEAKRNWIYDSLAPDAYSLRDELNRALLPMFGLDKKQFFIDCDIMALPDLGKDMKEIIDALKEAWWLTPNQKRMEHGYEADKDPNMDKYYVPGSLVPMDQLNEEIGRPLDDEEDILNRA